MDFLPNGSSFSFTKNGLSFGLPYCTVKKHHESIKISEVKCFTFGDMSMATNNFDPLTQIGKGGYGKVYKGRLSDGMIVAIKRAQEGSLQGAKEFYTEIELLSRVHHRNLVSLIGYCDDDGEQVRFTMSFGADSYVILINQAFILLQMLVYEYMPNGTLQEHLSRKFISFLTLHCFIILISDQFDNGNVTFVFGF